MRPKRPPSREPNTIAHVVYPVDVWVDKDDDETVDAYRARLREHIDADGIEHIEDDSVTRNGINAPMGSFTVYLTVVCHEGERDRRICSRAYDRLHDPDRGVFAHDGAGDVIDREPL